MKTENNLILSRGKIDFRSHPLGGSNRLAMVPLDGKHVTSWITDDFLAKGTQHAMVLPCILV